MYKKMLAIGVVFLMLSIWTVPAFAAVHNIKNGESLYKIALNNGITLNELKQANRLTSDRIFAGAKLEIPSDVKTIAVAVTKNHDLDLLARLITAEAGGEPFKGQVAVASVILNRIGDAKFPATIAGNIFKPHQFESVSNGLIWEQPTQDAYKAAKAAFKGWDPTKGAKFFFNPAKVHGPSWVWTRTIINRIGNHVFGV